MDGGAAALILGVGVFVGRWALTPATVLSASLEQLEGNAARTLPVLGPYASFQPRGMETRVPLPSTRQAVHLRIYAGLSQGPFQISLVRLSDAGPEYSLGSVLVQTDEGDDFVSFYADSRRLAAGRYKVLMSNPAEVGREPEIFMFEFEKPAEQP